MKIEKNTEMLCLRFVDVGGLDCISEHENIIDNKGVVWFGKIGIKPGENRVKSILSEGSGYVILKKPDGVYICKFNEYSYDKPNDHDYPLYYDDKELLDMRDFSMWFKVSKILKIDDKNILEDIVIKSSREPFMITANKSMSSIFYVVNRQMIDLSSPTN